jgi:hypothetical protein
MASNLPVEDETQGLPVFGSWRNAYLAIVLVFILEVGLFCLIERYFE